MTLPISAESFRAWLPDLKVSEGKHWSSHEATCPVCRNSGSTLLLGTHLWRDGWLAQCTHCDDIDGDLFDLVQKMEKVDLQTAYDQIAQKLGWGDQYRDEVMARCKDWRSIFKKPGELDSSPETFLIDGLISHGLTYIGAPPGSGKTWLALRLARSFARGESFAGHTVPKKHPVLYLCPEMGESPLSSRMHTLRFRPDDDIYIFSQSGETINLKDDNLLEAIEHLRPVVFLDSISRFNPAKDENDARQANEFHQQITNILRKGAVGVIGLHHALKSASREKPTLENTLRGSSDFGAQADTIYALRPIDQAKLHFEMVCVKPRNFEWPEPITLIGRPHLDASGDFAVSMSNSKSKVKDSSLAVADCIQKNPDATYKEIESVTGVNASRIKDIALAAGWEKLSKRSPWTPTQQEPASISQLPKSLPPVMQFPAA